MVVLSAEVNKLYLYWNSWYLLGGSSVLTNNLNCALLEDFCEICFFFLEKINIPPTWWHARHQHRQLVQAAHPLSLLPATSPLTLMLPRKSTNTRITFSLSLTSPIRKSIGRPSGRTNRSSFIKVGFLVETSVMGKNCACVKLYLICPTPVKEARARVWSYVLSAYAHMTELWACKNEQDEPYSS